MAVKNENYSFLKSWSDIYVDEYVRTSSAMSDYHAHDYYEISLILSGEVKVLTPGVSSESDAPRAVLSAPGVPHYITCTEGTAYRRINVIFSEEFISASDDSSEVMGIFKREGCVISLDSESAELLAETARGIISDGSRFRQRLRLLCYLSLLSEYCYDSEKGELPEYVSDALHYLKENYSEKIVAEELARRVNVGRTTLMTGFKRYTGETIGEYILKCRLIAAVEMLSSGKTERECAEACGFGEISNLIRSFKRRFGITPRKYISVLKKEHDGSHDPRSNVNKKFAFL